MVRTNITSANDGASVEAADKTDNPEALLTDKCPHRLHSGADSDLNVPGELSSETARALTISNALAVAGHQQGKDPSVELNDICSEITRTVKIMQKKGSELLKLQLLAGSLFTRAKSLLPHGRFLDWVKSEFGYSRSWCNILMRAAAVEPMWFQARDWAVENGEPFEASPRGVLNLVERYRNAVQSSEPHPEQEKSGKIKKNAKGRLAEALAKVDAMKNAGVALIQALISAGKPVDPDIFKAFELDETSFVRPRQTRRATVDAGAPGLFDDANDQSPELGAPR